VLVLGGVRVLVPIALPVDVRMLVSIAVLVADLVAGLAVLGPLVSVSTAVSALLLVLVSLRHHCYPASREGERQCWPSR